MAWACFCLLTLLCSNANAVVDTDAGTDTLYVARRGWHIDVGFAVRDLDEPLNVFADEFPGASTIFFGFGDRRYLTSPHRGPTTLLRALWPGAGLLLVTGLRATPSTAFGAAHVIELKVSRAGLLQAQTFVWRALTDFQQKKLLTWHEPLRGSAKHVAVGIPGPYEGSSFYESRDTYSATHTCNTWVAEVLHQAQLPLPSRGIILASQLWRRVQRQRSVATSRKSATTAR